MQKIIVMLILVCSTAASADEKMFGLTRNGEPVVCADISAISTKGDDTVGLWILGFWSGMNAANHALVGDSTTASGVIGEVKLYCASHPSADLPQATFDTYATMRKSEKARR